jgi:poly-gamma-glutamate synthesis protein (capsule biosynthesis protein)
MNPVNEIRLLALGQSLIEHDLRENSYPGLVPLCERLKHADICFSNFEGALAGKNSTPTRQGEFFHGTQPNVLDCLKEFSINLLSLANNHAFDWGADGIRATIAQVHQRGFVCAGTGSSITEANTPAFLKTTQGTIALVAFASKIPDGSAATETQPGVNCLLLTENRELKRDDAQRILESIQHASDNADLVIAYHHDHYWETNRQDTPRWKMDWARECIDAGATAYISHGVPLIHGIEIYKHRPIFYGLGNFIFHTRTPIGKYESPVWESVIADCVFRNHEIIELRLQAITLNESGDAGENFFRTRGRPTLATGSQSQLILERLAKLSASFGTRLKIDSEHATIEL